MCTAVYLPGEVYVCDVGEMLAACPDAIFDGPPDERNPEGCLCWFAAEKTAELKGWIVRRNYFGDWVMLPPELSEKDMAAMLTYEWDDIERPHRFPLAPAPAAG